MECTAPALLVMTPTLMLSSAVTTLTTPQIHARDWFSRMSSWFADDLGSSAGVFALGVRQQKVASRNCVERHSSVGGGCLSFVCTVIKLLDRGWSLSLL